MKYYLLFFIKKIKSIFLLIYKGLNFLLTIFFKFPCLVIWRELHKIRRYLYRQGFLKVHSFEIPIISVGNIVFGGSGKTPFTVYLINLLSKNSKIMILTRGYKGNLEKGSGIITGGKRFTDIDPEEYGDEALILTAALDSNKGAVVVGKNRVKNLKKYFSVVKPQVILLEDGYQHLKLHRDLNIVLFDATMPLNRYKVFPVGYLREDLSALKDADVIVITRVGMVNPQKILELKSRIMEGGYKHTGSYQDKYGRPKLWVEANYHPTGIYNSRGELIYKENELKGKRVILAAGLANPTSFVQLLESMGAIIVHRAIFSDHHSYNEKEVTELLDLSTKLEALVIVTEKDMVKIRKLIINERLLFLGIEIRCIKGENELIDLILKTISFTWPDGKFNGQKRPE